MLNQQNGGAVSVSTSLLVAGLLAVLCPAALLVLDARRTVAPSTSATRALRHGTLTAATAAAALLLAVVGTAAWLLLGRGGVDDRVVACTPLAAAAVFLAVHALGERTHPRPGGELRTASLTSRTVADVAPRHLRRAVLVWAGVLAALLALGCLTASGPRHVERTLRGWTTTGAPYPGTWFAVPLALTAAAVLGLTYLTLRVVATRPAVADVDGTWDLALRRASAARVLRGVQLAFAFTVAGVLLMTFRAVHDLASTGPLDGVDRAGSLLSIAATGLLLTAHAAWVTGAVVAARRGAPRPTEAGPADAGRDDADRRAVAVTL